VGQAGANLRGFIERRSDDREGQVE
jgi:hypothetical protein